MKNKFEIPELTIILFEDELATDPIPTSGPTDEWGSGDKWEDDPNE